MVVHDSGGRGRCGFIVGKEMGGIMKGIREKMGVVIKLPWRGGIGGHYCDDGWGPIWYVNGFKILCVSRLFPLLIDSTAVLLLLFTFIFLDIGL